MMQYLKTRQTSICYIIYYHYQYVLYLLEINLYKKFLKFLLTPHLLRKLRILIYPIQIYITDKKIVLTDYY